MEGKENRGAEEAEEEEKGEGPLSADSRSRRSSSEGGGVVSSSDSSLSERGVGGGPRTVRREGENRVESRGELEEEGEGWVKDGGE